VSKRSNGKEEREKAYHQRIAARRDLEADEMMDAFGLLPVYRSLPSSVRELLRNAPRYEMDVVAGASLQGEQLECELFDAVRAAVLHGQPDKPVPLPLSLRMLYAALGYGQDVCRALRVDLNLVTEPDFVHPPGPAGEYTKAFAHAFSERFPELLWRLSMEHLYFPLYTRSSLGNRLYWAGLTMGPTRRSVFTVERTDSEPVPSVIQGISRPTRLCYVYEVLNGPPQPAVWRADQIGLPGDRTYPVHIQSHATKQWEQRLPNHKAHVMLFQYSLEEAVIVDARQGTGLLAYMDGSNRFGYFSFTLTDDGERVVLTTFLFLTMQGTPEYRLLGERLGLLRADIEYHRLDQAERFFQSDLALDPDLARSFGECGLGHLLTSPAEDGPLMWRGVAAGLRKYLGLPTK